MKTESILTILNTLISESENAKVREALTQCRAEITTPHINQYPEPTREWMMQFFNHNNVYCSIDAIQQYRKEHGTSIIFTKPIIDCARVKYGIS